MISAPFAIFIHISILFSRVGSMPVLSGLPVMVDRRSCGPDFGFGKEFGSFDGVLETGDSFG